MAEIPYTKPDRAPYYQTYAWSGVTQADTFAPVKLERALFAYSVQVQGTFGGASVALHGSLDGINYVPLRDALGALIALTAPGIASGANLILWVKPVATGGASQSLSVSLMASYQE